MIWFECKTENPSKAKKFYCNINNKLLKFNHKVSVALKVLHKQFFYCSTECFIRDAKKYVAKYPLTILYSQTHVYGWYGWLCKLFLCTKYNFVEINVQPLVQDILMHWINSRTRRIINLPLRINSDL